MRDLWSARGERLLAAGRFPAAAAAFGRALKRSPGNASLWLRAADCAFLNGRPREAAAAAAKARALAGGPDLLRRELQARLIAGDESGARRALGARDLPEGEAAFWRGVLACRAARWPQARKDFLAAVSADPGRLAVRAGLFAAWAGHRAAGAPETPRGRGLVIAGLGWKRPRQASVGAFDALASCRSLFVVANTLDDDMRDVLSLFRADVSAVVFRGSEAEAGRAAKAALAAAARGRAGTVTRGNPLAYGRFAARLVAAARARNIPVEVLPGASAFEGLAAEVRPAPGEPLGLQLRGAFTAADSDPARALSAFTPTAAAGRRRLAKALPRLAAGRTLWWLASEGSAAAVPSRTTAARLAAALRAGPAPGILHLSPRRTP
jgi:hypothetical protein